MHIGKAENWTASVAIGGAGRCAGDNVQADASNLVNFHVPSHRVYNPGEPVARACKFLTLPAGCHANNPPPDLDCRLQAATYQRYDTGWFTVRIYGRICDRSSNPNCTGFRPTGPVTPSGHANFDCSTANREGYLATFKPGPNCGPAKWPTRYLRDIGGPAYAEWCDFTVDAARMD